jgi:hypothetical protein
MTAGTRPVYVRLLRLRHLKLSPAASLLLFEGSVALAVLFSLAEIIMGWAVVAVPVAVALMVKFNDVIAGLLNRGVAEAQLHGPRLSRGKAIGRSPMLRPSRPTTWIAGDDAVADPAARGVAAVPVAHPTNERRPRPGVRAPEPPLPEADVPDQETSDVRPDGTDTRGRLNKGRFSS